MRKRDTFHKKSHRSPSYQLKYRQYRNRVTYLIRSAKNKYLRQLKPTSKHFWKVVNSMNQKNSSIPMLISDDVEITSPADKATLLGDKFKNNFNTAVAPLNAEDLITVDPINCPVDLLCSEDEVLDIILSFDTNKASGLDGISARMLKETAYTISSIVCIPSSINQFLRALYPVVGRFPRLLQSQNMANLQIQAVTALYHYFP